MIFLVIATHAIGSKLTTENLGKAVITIEVNEQFLGVGRAWSICTIAFSCEGDIR